MRKSNASELVHPRLGKLPDRSNFSQYDANSEEVFCLCRKPDTGELMVACDGCDEWYHFKCIKLDKKLQSLVMSYYCPYCELEAKGSTLWKRKCRLLGCYNAIASNDSKYCSKKHGLAFMKSSMEEALKRDTNGNDTTLNKGSVIQIVNSVKDFNHLEALGNQFPEVPIDVTQNPRVLKMQLVLENLSKDRKEMIQRKKLLIRTRENIKKINDLLKNDEVESSTTNQSKKSKTKSKKVEICGYDPIFRLEKLEEDSFNEESLKSNDFELLKDLFMNMKNGEQEDTQDDNRICLLEKKKCLKHNGWQSMINDEIEMKIGNIDYRIASNEEILVKIIKSLKIDYFETQK